MPRKTGHFARVGRGYRQFIFMPFITVGLAIALAGCAAQTQISSRLPATGDVLEQKISAAFLKGKPEAAREPIAAALRANPQNGYLHLLNGLSYQLEEGSSQSLELAKVGYDAAVKFAPGYFWSHYLAGSAALHSQDYPEAAEQFCKAILDDPDRSQAFVGLAISAYFAGDLAVAHAAAERALALTPRDPAALRTAAYVAAARGDRRSFDAVLKEAEAVPAAARDLKNHKTRLSQLLRTAALDPGQVASEKPQSQVQPPAILGQTFPGQTFPGQTIPGQTIPGQTFPGQTMPGQVIPGQVMPGQPIPGQAIAGQVTGGGPNQVMLEVTILLSQDSTTRRVGINLLDGLATQFSLDYLTEKKILSGVADTLSRTLTTALRVPQITYSLNLFNTKDDFYELIARPSLVASLGLQSEFFIGRTLTVGVSGINLGSLQPVDVGTAIRVTPNEITRERTKFRVDMIRSFFVPGDTGSTFQQAVTTFKQIVGATVEVEFGKTLILSGLYEAVNVGGSSRVPGLGDIPVLNTLFNARTKTERRDAALVLVTPRLAGMVETNMREFRSETLNKLLLLWKDLVDPMSNIDAVINKLGYKVSNYFRPQAGDLRLPSVSDPNTVGSVIKETMSRLY